MRDATGAPADDRRRGRSHLLLSAQDHAAGRRRPRHRAISALSPYVAGKPGTTEDSVIGFTNDVTIAVWVGYDNGDGERHSLGSTETGARVALPIFEPIINAVRSENIASKGAAQRTLARGAGSPHRPADRLCVGPARKARRLRRAFPA
jgi:membrane peptidoglycan carboxypeptidase